MPTGGRVAELVEERDYLLRSIEDLEREHAAGDIDEADYQTLRAGYVERAATAIRALEALEAASTRDGSGAPRRGAARGTAAQARGARVPSVRSGDAAWWASAGRLGRFRRRLGRRSTRRVLVPVGVVCVLGLVTVAAARAAGIRLPGEYASGSVTLTSAAQVRQELDQAALLATEGRIRSAITVYDTVLAAVPDQAEALAYKGWLVRLAGTSARSARAVADGDALLAKVVRVAPGYAEGRAFDGIALLEDDNDVRGAVVEFAAMVADRPATTLRASVASSITSHYAALGTPVPRALERFGVQTGRTRGS
jgi:hypothetical protein